MKVESRKSEIENPKSDSPVAAHRGRPAETERDEQIKRDYAILREQLVRPDRAIRMLAKQYCRHPNVIRRALKRSVMVPE